MSDVNLVDSKVDQSVMDLVDHIWTEATGHLDDILSTPAANITVEQVMRSQPFNYQNDIQSGSVGSKALSFCHNCIKY